MSIFEEARAAQQRMRSPASDALPRTYDESRFDRRRLARLNQRAGRQSPPRAGGPQGLATIGRAFRVAMNRMGPVGQILNAALDATRGRDVGDRMEQIVRDLEQAKQLYPQFRSTYDALLAGAQSVLDESEKQAPPLRDFQPPPPKGGGQSPPPGPGEPGGPPPGQPPTPPGTPPAPVQGPRPQLIPTILEPAASPPGAPPRPGEQTEWSDEVRVTSSNVWSFRYHFPSSTLAVQYKAPALNPKGVRNRRGSIQGRPGKSVMGNRNSPGPIYYYSGVPVRVFRLLTNATSAGGAVWDYIRVRGTQWGHQYPYRLASASVQPGEGGKLGVWVPRRATPRGYRYRTQAHAGRGRRGYIESSLPQQITAEPNRGEPDRGRPQTGRMF